MRKGCERPSSGTAWRQIESVDSFRDKVWYVELHHCIISSRSWIFSDGVGGAEADVPVLSLPRRPRESEVGEPRTESVRPLSEPEARNAFRGSDGAGVEDSSFAQRRELEEPYSHSACRFAQFEHVGRASSH